MVGGLLLSLYDLHALNRDVNMIQSINQSTVLSLGLATFFHQLYKRQLLMNVDNETIHYPIAPKRVKTNN